MKPSQTDLILLVIKLQAECALFHLVHITEIWESCSNIDNNILVKNY